MIVDTHVHLNDEQYNGQVDLIIKEANDNNVLRIFTMGCNKDSSIEAVDIANHYDGVYAFVGVHPSDANTCDNLDWIYDLSKNNKVIGIGEIGLDYYWDRSFIEKQKEIFIKQIEISKELNLPISVHSRDANQDTFDILKKYRPKGIIHCYSGSLEMAKEFVKLGFYIGVGGVVTFKNSKNIKEVVKNIDLDYLVTETDGPYLAPTPFRGTTNYPKYVKLIIEEIARIKEVDVETVEKKIEENIKILFNQKII